MTARQLLPDAPATAREVYDTDGYVRANMVSSLDGAATVDGRVGDLTGDHDQEILLLLRELADVVVVGAGTIRAEGYGPLRAKNPAARVERGQTPHPTLVILSRSGNLDLSAWPDDERPWVITAPPGGELDLVEVIDRLRGEGHRRILTEGGPALLGDLLAADVLTELCLTTTPRTVGGDGRRITDGPLVTREFQLTSLLEADGELFAQYRR